MLEKLGILDLECNKRKIFSNKAEVDIFDPNNDVFTVIHKQFEANLKILKDEEESDRKKTLERFMQNFLTCIMAISGSKKVGNDLLALKYNNCESLIAACEDIIKFNGELAKEAYMLKNCILALQIKYYDEVSCPSTSVKVIEDENEDHLKIIFDITEKKLDGFGKDPIIFNVENRVKKVLEDDKMLFKRKDGMQDEEVKGNIYTIYVSRINLENKIKRLNEKGFKVTQESIKKQKNK